ncbi:MAG: hypothetical protein AABX11_01175 [Nanoarchaeota archaeon]
MKKILLGAVVFLAVFILAVSFVGAQNASNESEKSFNVGSCVNDLTKVRNSCENATRLPLKECKEAVKNKSSLGFFGRIKSNGACNKVRKTAFDVCKKEFKDGRNVCKAKDKEMKAQVKAQKGK